MDDIQKIIEILDLTPLSQEGGLFRSSYRSPGKVNGRDMGSAIYFMLTGQGYSHLHRLCTDEVYHFYAGDPVELLELLPDGTSAPGRRCSMWSPPARGRAAASAPADGTASWAPP